MVQCSSTENFGAIQTLNASSETISPKRINLEIAVGMPVEIGTMPRRKHFLMKGHICPLIIRVLGTLIGVVGTSQETQGPIKCT